MSMKSHVISALFSAIHPLPTTQTDHLLAGGIL